MLSSYRTLKMIYDSTCSNYERQVCSGLSVHRFKNLSAEALGELQLALHYILKNENTDAELHIEKARTKVNSLAGWVGNQIRGSNNDGESQWEDDKIMLRM
jgi:hypothetical protein